MTLAKEVKQERKNSENHVILVSQVLRYQRTIQDLFVDKINEIFHKIVTKLTEQKISEESFQTFEEFYKNAKESIDRRTSYT
ncbi:hypothetical protein G7B40_026420 [Aetokthonos hydrillicola Thurmond2011]|uniref:Uncharacterized protein n=1 Tax=Aetokthonos hydrillicola Thurmond2011 TaxID=2712845 RepID=A0AAP5MCI0_9CYAN|nr:hypothetical protein [Aetokthonos hydrillicola]MBO3461462.1 hypothetical protein [Aetokthonos hydrillicola CCALA 1050]MBW4584899.1 hypothetical protein [Aetokthonos hydrillicola CCALA 1050]MDR9898069.1 hypothetical protein [Aetokthonos hydrillicola Thurmond2011]